MKHFLEFVFDSVQEVFESLISVVWFFVMFGFLIAAVLGFGTIVTYFFPGPPEPVGAPSEDCDPSYDYRQGGEGC